MTAKVSMMLWRSKHYVVELTSHSVLFIALMYLLIDRQRAENLVY